MNISLLKLYGRYFASGRNVEGVSENHPVLLISDALGERVKQRNEQMVIEENIDPP